LEPVEPQQEESTEPQQEELAEPQHEEDVLHSQGNSNDPSNNITLSDPDDSDLEQSMFEQLQSSAPMMKSH
jgi:hypothetical protein